MDHSTGAFHDVAIAGGGPAGAVAAILLVRAGLRVALVDAGEAPRRVEGASPRLVAALSAQRLAGEGIGAPIPRRADWGIITGAPNREHAVLRPAFDEGLRAQAMAEGALVLTAGIARVRPGRIDCVGAPAVRAGLVIEARGRRAPVAPGRLRGPETITVGGWTDGGRGAAIVARPGGWFWTIAAAGGTWTQASVDASIGRAGLGQAFATLTGKELPERPLVRASELRLAAPELDPALPRIGDAAVAIDPLSGHGLFWALASALHTVPLARALIDGETELASRFYRDRVVETFFRQARIARDFYRAAGVEGPFWRARAIWPDNAPAEAPPPAGAHLRRQVVVRGGRFAWADALVTPRDPAGVAFVRGREIAPILARAGGGPLPDRGAFATRVMPDAPPEEAGFIHDWLRDRGITTADLPKDKEVTE